MKIGILTQPLHTNYGGLLQAYALQTTLKRLGHAPWIIQRVERRSKRRIRYIKYLIKRLLHYPGYYVRSWQQEVLEQHISRFVNSITPKTEKITDSRCLKRITNDSHFEGYVVGSDQVWRPCYSPEITNYFLDFCKESRNIKRIAYAASFGVDAWEFTKQETKKCAPLAKLFNAISVREESAVRLCAEKLGMEAVHVLDPTLLLEKEDYEELVKDAGDPRSAGNLFYYVLDETEEKARIVGEVAHSLSLTAFTTKAFRRLSRENLRDHLDECVFSSVTSWIRGFMDAECVVTDSFHGCVFSIIFNKPFWVIGNQERGLTRFHSLLKLFGLEDRLLQTDTIQPIDYARPINWDAVNAKKKEMQHFSIDFLKQHLGS